MGNQVLIEYKGVLRSLPYIADDLGIPRSTIAMRYRRGLQGDDLFRKVVRENRKCIICRGVIPKEKNPESKVCSNLCSRKRKNIIQQEGRVKLIQQRTEEVGIIDVSNYKEPLKKVENGFGYYGTISLSENRKYIQCHVCGRWCVNLGVHVVRGHGYKNSSKYREEYGLSHSTALCGDELRGKYIESCNKNKPFLKARESFRKHRGRRREFKPRLEALNKKGTCPDQLLDKIRIVYKSIGKVPSYRDFNRFYGGKKYLATICYTFGSWNNAITEAGLSIFKERLGEQFNPELMLRLLRVFYVTNRRVPRESDHSRGVIPSGQTYRRVFTSMNEARMRAGIPILRRNCFRGWSEFDPLTGKDITYNEWLEKYGHDVVKDLEVQHV